VTEILGTVNLRIQKSARANMMVVHVDKVKQCMGKTLTSWLGKESDNVLPAAMEPDVLPNMFGGVNRGGVDTFNDDGEINVIVRPKRNAGVPARFLSRIYAVYKDAPLDVYNHMNVECMNNIGDLCLSRFSSMKRTAKKVDTFLYKCFPCLKQDDKARSYTRSYDLILHTVNTHRKFPVDERHNAYYAADGSDLRDATAEEIEKYRLAASHKRRKPESSCDKSGEKKKLGHSSRERDDDDHRKRDKERPVSRESKDGRAASKGSRNERTTSRESQRGRDKGHRGSGDSASGRSAERDKQTNRGSTVGMDDDERDRRKLAEIIKRMDERKLVLRIRRQLRRQDRAGKDR